MDDQDYLDSVRYTIGVLYDLSKRKRAAETERRAVNRAPYMGEAPPRRKVVAGSTKPNSHLPHCNVVRVLAERSPYEGECLLCTCNEPQDNFVDRLYLGASRVGKSDRMQKDWENGAVMIGPGSGYVIPVSPTALKAPTTDAEAEQWIEAVLRLDEKHLKRLYQLLYNKGYRVNA